MKVSAYCSCIIFIFQIHFSFRQFYIFMHPMHPTCLYKNVQTYLYQKYFACYGNDIYVYTIDNKRFQVKQQLLMFAYVYLFNTQFLHINIKQGDIFLQLYD